MKGGRREGRFLPMQGVSGPLDGGCGLRSPTQVPKQLCWTRSWWPPLGSPERGGETGGEEEEAEEEEGEELQCKSSEHSRSASDLSRQAGAHARPLLAKCHV